MSIKTIRASIARAFDGKSLEVVSETGAKYTFEPEPESHPTVVVWGKGDLVRFRKFDVTSRFSWRGVRGDMGTSDSGLFAMKTDEN